MKIEIWSDFGCPFCYIGKTRFEKALAAFPHKDEVEVTYKAYQLNPVAPQEMTLSPAKAFAKGHNMTEKEAKERFKMFVKSAKSEGLTYNYDIIQMTNTFDAHRLAKWANEQGKEEALTAIFMKAYFTDGLNIADHNVLVDLVTSIGLDGKVAKAVLESDQYKTVVESQITEARQVGVRGVPFFVLNRKYGVSGAQPVEYFSQVLNQLWEETNPIETLESETKGGTCTDDHCTI